ncbi:MIR motif domain-containing protein [Rozella allomycis CSF55]|uniref:dolichyl-phosphate-mannose--protein mannosyltransferase n=1 Tax=Rozella allomycis (strain CSF55) TaxID=988480 RepID=A0A075AY47_ROZAC|nr:MIR motif domain-containing protein [Rozella allomycis CSF55]|eukprot:EPZ35059.1 MIR motif domain-containing protein [Rozella allomycis CSF55]
MSGVPYIGSTIMLISKADIRYEGTLSSIDTEQSSVTLENVRSYGTEGRTGGVKEVPPSDQVYECIIFRSTEIKDLHVSDYPQQQVNQPNMPENMFANNGMQSMRPPGFGYPQMGYGVNPAMNPYYMQYQQQYWQHMQQHGAMMNAGMFDQDEKQPAFGQFGQNAFSNPSYAPYPAFGYPPQHFGSFAPPSFQPPKQPVQEEKKQPSIPVKETVAEEVKKERKPSPEREKKEEPKQPSVPIKREVKQEVKVEAKNERNEIEKEKPESSNRRFSGSRGGYVRRGGRGGHRGGRHGGITVPETEFNFEESNAKFNKEDLPKEESLVSKGYDKSTSFFDNISCESRERELAAASLDRKAKLQEDRRLNIETFGKAGTFDNNRRVVHTLDLDMNDEIRRRNREQTPSPTKSSSDVDEKDKYIEVPPTSECYYDQENTKITIALLIFGLITRLYQINKADFVVWDEAHFGKFGSQYLRREFYHDVHPPLGKMLVGLAGFLSGYNGTFGFESGSTYPAELNYGMFRGIPAALFVGILALADCAWTTISRFILLDGMLIFFTVLTVYSHLTFVNSRDVPFSLDWWLAIVLTGVSIGFVSSVKWVGLFTMALVGLYTIEDLWDMLGDLRMPKMTFLKHFFARVVCLILLPIGIYMFFFQAHFMILNSTGSGDSHMSSLFQANLRGSKLLNNPLDVAYGSLVTIKNQGHGGGLLHSHIQTFPSGSKQQQVTLYHHKDDNNNWIIKKEHGVEIDDEKIQFIQNGDKLRLFHSATKRNLHSHNLAAPLTKYDNEVSCYGNDTWKDPNDFWIIEIASDLRDNKNLTSLKSLTTSFRLKHSQTGCYLRSSIKNLPEWGFKQLEVSCEKKLKFRKDSLWNIEMHKNDKLPPAPPGHFKTNFINDFLQLNVAMWITNNALTPDPDKEPDELTSSPYEWPLLLRGLRMASWKDEAVKFYLIGNPVVWWGGFVSLLLISFLYLFYILRFKRGYYNWTIGDWHWFTIKCKTIIFGWILHFIPFCLMGRVTYLHHYFPALFFAMLGFGFVLDHLFLRKIRNIKARNLIAVLFSTIVCLVFLFFTPVVFGFQGPAKDLMVNHKWLDSWNIY